MSDDSVSHGSVNFGTAPIALANAPVSYGPSS